MELELRGIRAQYQAHKTTIKRAVDEVLRSGRFIGGEKVEQLEEALCRRTGAAHAVSCASGTDALVLLLRGLDIGPGDAVFVPAFTFFATAGAVLLAGATPVFVDVGADFCLCPESLRSKVQTLPPHLHPKAVIAVDLFGLPADYAAILPIAEEYGLFLLEDAAQAFGAGVQLEEGWRPAGRLGMGAAFSFFPSKPLGGYGDGGALLTGCGALACRARMMKNHGQAQGLRYHHLMPGFNSRLDALQAAVLLAKLEFFDQEQQACRQVARRYHQLLQGAVQVPAEPEGRRSAWAQYTVRFADEAQRERVRRALAKQQIPCAVYYPLPLHRQPVFGAQPPLPMAERLCRQVLSLPMHPYLDEGQQQQVCQAVLQAL